MPMNDPNLDPIHIDFLLGFHALDILAFTKHHMERTAQVSQHLQVSIVADIAGTHHMRHDAWRLRHAGVPADL